MEQINIIINNYKLYMTKKVDKRWIYLMFFAECVLSLGWQYLFLRPVRWLKYLRILMLEIGDFGKERWFTNMKLCRCENGHFYDEDKFQTCPLCNDYTESNLSEKNEQIGCLTEGAVLGERYLVKKMIGIGGFGITYEGTDLPTNNNIAIKEYYPPNLVARNNGQNEIFIADNSKEFFTRGLRILLKEAKRLKSLNDIPGVVNIVDCFEENNTGYIIMELLEGSTLKEIIKVNGKINYNIAKNLISNILRTMNLVHDRNIIHGDLTPNNIIVTKDGTVKV